MRSPEGKNPPVPTRESPDGKKSGLESTRTPSKKRVFKELPDIRIDLTPVSPPPSSAEDVFAKSDDQRADELGIWTGPDDSAVSGQDQAKQLAEGEGQARQRVVSSLRDRVNIDDKGGKMRALPNLNKAEILALSEHVQKVKASKKPETPPPAAPPPKDQGVLGKIRKLFGG